MSQGHVVVLSGEYKLKTAVSDIVKRTPGLTVDITSFDIDSAQMRFIKNAANILVLDIDHFKIEQRFLKALTEKYMLFIIMVGARQPFFDPSICFIGKSPDQTPAGFAKTAGQILLKIRSRAATSPSFTVQNMARYVDTKQKIIAIAASTGGTDALPAILSQLNKDIPPVLIVQHMPSMFTKQLADRIDRMSILEVKEAQDGEMIKAGTAYIAPGDLHMRMVVRQRRLALECFFGDKLHGVRPAADILFDSVANISGSNSIGVVLTGMGSDGARGLVEMKKKGAKVIGQNKETSVVYGMPRAAFELGAVDYQLPLEDIAKKLTDLCLT